MTYKELFNDLKDFSENFTMAAGVYRVVDKSDVEVASSILKHYYLDVNEKNLDYQNNSPDGINYLIRFSKPIEDNRMNEDLITKRDLEAARLILKHDTDPRHIKKAQDVIKKYKEQNKEDVDEAIEKHDTLNPKLWDENNELKPEVRKKIEEIVQKFDDNLKENDVELDVKDIAIIGSNANYNYSPDSDVDIHIIADTSVYPDQKDLAMKVYLAYKSLFNNKYDPTLNGIEAEVYVEPDEVHANSNGVYSLKDGWLKEPEQVDVPEIDPNHVQELIQPFEDRYNELINSDPSVSDVDKLIDDIYLQRQQSILKDGEFGDGNICFKEFRNRGYLQNLRDLKVELENKEMSLNDMNEQFLYLNNLNEDCEEINEQLVSDDLFVGAEFVEPDTGSRIVITSIEDDLVTYDETLDGGESVTITDPISYFISTLNEYDYVLDENCKKDLKEDIFENENGMEISFPDPRDTLAVFLEWEGIIGYTDEIYEHAQEGYDALDEFLEYEGILGYTSKIYEIINTGSAWCSQMEMEDFLSVCKSLYIDYTLAIDDDDIDEKLEESGDLYLGSKWNNKNDRDRYFRTVPKYRIKDKLTNKSFTAQCGRWDSIDDVKKEYPEDHYEVKLVEATKVGLVSAAKSALNKYCDKLKDASAEEIYDKALEHASKSEYPFVKDNLTAKKDVAIDYINKRKEAMSTDDLDEDFVIDDKPGTKYRNKNGIILKMEEPTEDGEIQFAIIDNGEIIDHRKMSDLKSFARMVDANGYEKLTEDTVKQGDKWVNKGKEGTHGKFKTKKAADDQRKAMFANGYHESLDEGTAFDGMPGYMTPEEIRAKKLADKEKLDAEKEQVKAQKAAERKEKAKAERARQKRIDQRAKVNSLSYDSLADMAGLPEDNNDLTKDELLAILRASMSDEEILKLHKKMFEGLNEGGISRIWQHTQDDDTFAIIGSQDKDTKEDRSKELIKKVRELNLGFKPLFGSYEYEDGTIGKELSLLIPNISLEDAKRLMNEVNQECIIFKDKDFFGFIDQNGNPDGEFSKDAYNMNFSDEDIKIFGSRLAKHKNENQKKPWKFVMEQYIPEERNSVRNMGENHKKEKIFELDRDVLDNVDANDLREATSDLNESHKDWDLIFDRDTGDRQVEYGINWIQFTTDNYDDAVRWARQLDAAMAGDIDEYGEPSDDSKYYDPENYPKDIQEVDDGKFNFRRRRDILDSIEKVDFVDTDDIHDLDEAIDDSDVAGKALANYLDIPLEDLDYVGDDIYETQDTSYIVCDEDEAYKKAVDEIKMLVDDMGLDAFTPHFKDWIIDNAIDEDAIDDIIEQEIEYFEDDEDNPDMLTYLRGLNTLDDKVNYIKDLYGDSLSIWAKDYIDINKVADEAISEDGVAHFIAQYDGEEVDLGNNLFAYRIY